MKRFFLRAGRLWCAGLVLLLLRLAQNWTGFDPATGLALPGLPGTLLIVALVLCAAVELALFLRLSNARTSFSNQFAPPDKETSLAVTGSMLLVCGGVLLAVDALPRREAAGIAAGVLGAAAGVGLLLLVRRIRAGAELTVAPMLPVLCFCVLFVLAVYLPAESDPVLARYYIPVLASAMAAYAFSQLAGFLRREGSPRSFVFTGDMAVILCLTAIAGGGLGRKMLFAGCALALTGFLLLRRDEALPEEEEPDEADGADPVQ